MRAADKALRNTAVAMKRQNAPATPEVDMDIAHFHAKRMLQGPRVQIVAP
jgi:hypothetical protein